MYTIDDCSEYQALTAATAKGITTCCDAPVIRNDDNQEVCPECAALVIAIVPF
jgi:hypothetical protein